MTVARITKRRTRLEKIAQEVIDDLVTGGLTQAEVAVKRKVSPNAVSEFVRRHSVEIVAQTRAIEEAATVYRIGVKEMRIADKNTLAQLLETVRQERAEGRTGLETGLVAKTYKMVGNGRNAQIVEEYKIDTALVSAIDQLHHSAAEELGQLPRPDQNINIKAAVLVRQIDGTNVEDIG